MKKLIWFAVLLAGCGGRTIHYVVDAPPAPVPSGLRAPERVAETPAAVHVAGGTDPTVPEPAVESLSRKPESVSITEVNGALEDAYFGYDKFDLSAEALASLRKDAALLCAILAGFPGLKVMIEGHCDERGSAEYNLGLGERRARRAEEALRGFGVAADAFEVISYGKEAPQCAEATENCRQRNRRAHMAVKRVETAR